MSSQVPRFVALNHQAIEMIRRGLYCRAVSLLKLAVFQLEQSSSSLTGRKTSANRIDAVDVILVDLGECSSSNSIRVPLSSSICLGCHFRLLNRVLVVCGSELDLSASFRSEARTLAVLCYNLGMAYHLKAMKEKWNCEKDYQNALKFYDLVTAIIGRGVEHDGTADSPSTSYEDDVLLRISVFNNKGHIHSRLHQEKEVKVCVEALAALMGQNMKPQGVLGADVATVVTLNVLLYGQKQQHASAA